jgi:two-component system, OmpR family, sensor kinase
MSLRLRLTLLYSTFMGGILFIFVAAIFVLINVILLNQVDTMLARVVRDITEVTRVNPVGRLNIISLPPLDMASNAYVQVWRNDGKLVSTSPSIETLSDPLDSYALRSGETMYHDSWLGTAHLRVLTVPLNIGAHTIGSLQLGTSLAALNDGDHRGGGCSDGRAGFMDPVGPCLLSFGNYHGCSRSTQPRR